MLVFVMDGPLAPVDMVCFNSPYSGAVSGEWVNDFRHYLGVKTHFAFVIFTVSTVIHDYNIQLARTCKWSSFMLPLHEFRGWLGPFCRDILMDSWTGDGGVRVRGVMHVFLGRGPLTRHERLCERWLCVLGLVCLLIQNVYWGGCQTQSDPSLCVCLLVFCFSLPCL